jgi:hypothetical protein
MASSTYPRPSSGVDDAQRLDLRGRAHGVVHHRALALRELEGRAHGLERQEDVGEEDRRVDGQRLHGLKGDLHGELGGAAELEEGVLLAQRAVLGHVAPGLAHEPHGGAVDGFARHARRNRSLIAPAP